MEEVRRVNSFQWLKQAWCSSHQACFLYTNKNYQSRSLSRKSFLGALRVFLLFVVDFTLFVDFAFLADFLRVFAIVLSSNKIC